MSDKPYLYECECGETVNVMETKACECGKNVLDIMLP